MERVKLLAVEELLGGCDRTERGDGLTRLEGVRKCRMWPHRNGVEGGYITTSSVQTRIGS
jgi:hypothetical protein